MRHQLAVLVLATALVPASTAAQRSGSTIPTEKIFEAIGVREGSTVCEIGAGDGELTIAAARIVGPQGRVYTSELGDENLERLRNSVERSELAQITVAEGHPDRTNFPDAACGALFMRNVYHHFESPGVMNASISSALAPGGRLAIVDFTPSSGNEAVNPANRDNDGTHGVSADSVARELKAAGLEVVSTEQGDGRWFMVVATKPDAERGPLAAALLTPITSWPPDLLFFVTNCPEAEVPSLSVE